MTSFENLVAMEPWLFRSSAPLFSDAFYRETDALSKVLQQSTAAEDSFPAAAGQNPSASGPAGSGGASENETAVSRRRKTGVAAGKITKRKTRASKRAATTYITADAANFRQMVQQVTGVRFTGDFTVPAILKPEPHRPPPHAAAAQHHTSGGLPTLDTSAFLLHHTHPTPPATIIAPPPTTVVDGGLTGFDFDSFASFPTLESWN